MESQNKTLDTGYRPRVPQKLIHNAVKDNRFVVVVAHRRMGKTVSAINQLIHSALMCTKKEPRYAYVAPTYNQSKRIAWDYLVNYTRPLGAKVNIAELRVDFMGRRISLYGADTDRVKVVTPGVDLQRFTPGHGKASARNILDIAPDAIMLLFVGRIQPHKGPEVLIRATSELVKHSPHLRPKLVINIIGGASGANGEEVERLQELTTWLGIDDVVRFMPPTPRADLPQWYRAADLVCVPSYSESFGLVALEAQACGTPVVATAVGGLRTAVADGISGVLVDGHDAKAWSSVIARLLLEPQRRVLLSMGAIEHASHFGWDTTARGTLDIYDLVITENNAARKIAGE